MNIKTINQLETTQSVSGTYGICSDEEGNTKKYYLNDSPFEKGEGENSAVLKGGNNIAGLKGWYYKAIQFNSNTGTVYLYLTETQQIPTIVTTIKEVSNPENTISFNLTNGTVLSIINDAKYDNQFKLVENEISKYGRIIVTPISGEFPFTKIKTDDELTSGNFDSEDYSVYSTSNPLSGVDDMGELSIAIGLNNRATNNKAVAFGYNNHSYGKFSFTEGRDNKSAYCSHAEGWGTSAEGQCSHSEGKNTVAIEKYSHAEGQNSVASGGTSHAEGYNTKANGQVTHSEGYNTTADGDYSHSEGRDTIASAQCSHAEGKRSQAIGNSAHAEGYDTYAKGKYSHAEGYGTKTSNEGEHASGKFYTSTQSSLTNKATQFSIGIGTSDTDRKNAFEVKQNGDIYIWINNQQYKLQDLLSTLVPQITEGEENTSN